MRRVIAIGIMALMLATTVAAEDGSARFSGAPAARRLTLSDLSRGPSIIGAGIMLGEPSGITAKLWFVESRFAVDAAVAWSFTGRSSLYMHGSLLYHLAAIETAQGRYIAPYLGLGVKTKFSAEGYLGLRLPFGVSFMPLPNLPLELFAELAPGLGLLPSTAPDFGAAIGARFYLPL